MNVEALLPRQRTGSEGGSGAGPKSRDADFVRRGGSVKAVLDYHCAVAERHGIFFLWRPHLRDPRDDLVLELAVAAGAKFIITHNIRDFAGSEDFGVRAIPPVVFLRQIGEIE